MGISGSKFVECVGQTSNEEQGLGPQSEEGGERDEIGEKGDIHDSEGPAAKKCNFHSLPPEVRTRIFKMVLSYSCNFVLKSVIRRQRRKVIREPREPGRRPCKIDVDLLKVDRQTAIEASAIFYRENFFILEDTIALHHFLAAIGSANAAHLLKLRVESWGQTKTHKAFNFPAFTLLRSATSLRLFSINSEICRGNIGHIARQFYQETYHYLDAVVAARNGDIDKAVRFISISKKNFENWERRRLDDEEGIERQKAFRKELSALIQAEKVIHRPEE
ncbi:hypothetical protein ACLMJK_004907 [Lecanora helva]